MQGVRTTRGCIGCRRRKKGCDFQTPCGRCRRLNIPCHYETRRFRFVNASSEASSFMIVPEAEPALASPSQASLWATDLAIQADATFWELYLPQQNLELDGNIDDLYLAPWVHTIRSLATEDGHLQIAVNALAFAGLGWMQNDYSLVQRGLRLYTKALQQTNRVLQDPHSSAAQSDAVLASCRILSLFEMYRRLPSATTARAQTVDWQSHIDGSCRLIQLRGLAKHSTEHGIKLYDAIRLTAIIHGIAKRRPNAFINLSWDIYKYRRKTLRDELFEIMSTIPDLYQRFDAVGARTKSELNLLELRRNVAPAVELLQDLLVVAGRLQIWEARAIQLCQRKQSSSPVKVEKGKPGETLMDFCTLFGDGFFATCANYWASCLKVFPTARLLRQQILALPGSPMNLPALPSWMDAEQPAHNLADITPHFFRPGAGFATAQSAVFPLGAVLFYLARTGRRESPVFMRMMNIFTNSKTGGVMRDFVQSIVDFAVEYASGRGIP